MPQLKDRPHAPVVMHMIKKIMLHHVNASVDKPAISKMITTLTEVFNKKNKKQEYNKHSKWM